MNALDHGSVLHLDDLHSRLRAPAPQLQHSLRRIILDADYPTRPQSCNMHNGAKAMGTIEGRKHSVAPVLRLSVGYTWPDGLTVVNILPFPVGELAQLSLPVQPPHFPRRREIAVILQICIYLSGFHRFHQRHRLGQILCRKHLGGHVTP